MSLRTTYGEFRKECHWQSVVGGPPQHGANPSANRASLRLLTFCQLQPEIGSGGGRNRGDSHKGFQRVDRATELNASAALNLHVELKRTSGLRVGASVDASDTFSRWSPAPAAIIGSAELQVVRPAFMKHEIAFGDRDVTIGVGDEIGQGAAFDTHQHVGPKELVLWLAAATENQANQKKYSTDTRPHKP
jgi:hypothetical protein